MLLFLLLRSLCYVASIEQLQAVSSDFEATVGLRNSDLRQGLVSSSTISTSRNTSLWDFIARAAQRFYSPYQWLSSDAGFGSKDKQVLKLTKRETELEELGAGEVGDDSGRQGYA